MKFSAFAYALYAVPALAAPPQARNRILTVELAPGETKQITEDEKWDLMKAGTNFVDITDYATLHSFATNNIQAAAVTFPSSVTQQTSVKPLLSKLSKANIQTTLEKFVSYNNRYYKSTTGKQSSEWLLSQVQSIISAANATTSASARAFTHSWGQSSVIATIPGKTANIIAIGAHQDSINQRNPSTGRAPGADDDGSGSMTILEAMRVVLSDAKVASGQAQNTIEFHWYSAEEAGLLGSQAIFQDYKTKGKVVKAMLQQDMTGYVKSGVKESVGVITDYVDAGLTSFIKKVVTAYCAIPYVETECGYACSDHASASKAGYPSAFVIEAAFENTSQFIHSEQDTISTVNFNHMIEHAKMTVGFGYELAFASL